MTDREREACEAAIASPRFPNTRREQEGIWRAGVAFARSEAGSQTGMERAEAIAKVTGHMPSQVHELADVFVLSWLDDEAQGLPEVGTRLVRKSDYDALKRGASYEGETREQELRERVASLRVALAAVLARPPRSAARLDAEVKAQQLLNALAATSEDPDA